MSDDFDDEDHKGGPQGFIDQREHPTRVGLICPDVRGQTMRHGIEARQAEFEGLAAAIRVEIVFSDVVKVREIRPGTFIGLGALEALAAKVKEGEVELLLVDAALSPVQQRNLETETKAKVLDRTGLILEIFGERAATREGVLQVELAHLNYQKGRLVRSWTHLERQRGGFGFLGGPGETQIETDRRLLQERISLIESRLDKVKKTRAQQRGGKDDRVVAMAARELVKSDARLRIRHRHANSDQHVLRAERRLEHALEEFVRRDCTAALHAGNLEFSLERDHAGRQFRRRIGIGERTANRATIADRHMRDVGHCARNQRRLLGDDL